MSIALGILFAGIVHLVCLAFYNPKVKIAAPEDINPKIPAVVENILPSPVKSKKTTPPSSPTIKSKPDKQVQSNVQKNSPIKGNEKNCIMILNHRFDSSHFLMKNEDNRETLKALRELSVAHPAVFETMDFSTAKTDFSSLDLTKLIPIISSHNLFHPLARHLVPQLSVEQIYDLHDRKIFQLHHWSLLSYDQGVALIEALDCSKINETVWTALPWHKELMEYLSPEQVYELNKLNWLVKEDWANLWSETVTDLDFTKLLGARESFLRSALKGPEYLGGGREHLIGTFSPEKINTYIKENILFPETSSSIDLLLAKAVTQQQISKLDCSTITKSAFDILFDIKETLLPPLARTNMAELSFAQLLALHQRNFLSTRHWHFCSLKLLKAFIFSDKVNLDKPAFEIICPPKFYDPMTGATKKVAFFPRLTLEEFNTLSGKGFIALCDWELLAPDEALKLDFATVDSEIIKKALSVFTEETTQELSFEQLCALQARELIPPLIWFRLSDEQVKNLNFKKLKLSLENYEDLFDFNEPPFLAPRRIPLLSCEQIYDLADQNLFDKDHWFLLKEDIIKALDFSRFKPELLPVIVPNIFYGRSSKSKKERSEEDIMKLLDTLSHDQFKKYVTPHLPKELIGKWDKH